MKRTSTDGNVNDTPDSTLAIAFENALDLLRTGQVALECIDFCALLVCLRRVFGKCILRNLCDTSERRGEGVVMVVDRDDFVSSSLLKSVDDMRTWTIGKISVKNASWAGLPPE